jgi:hypothetical protein
MAGRCQEITTGTLTADTFIVNETPTGLINSINTDFQIANNPVEGTVEVHLNGLLQSPGTGMDYTISGRDIVFTKAPRTNMEILVSYAKEITT